MLFLQFNLELLVAKVNIMPNIYCYTSQQLVQCLMVLHCAYTVLSFFCFIIKTFLFIWFILESFPLVTPYPSTVFYYFQRTFNHLQLYLFIVLYLLMVCHPIGLCQSLPQHCNLHESRNLALFTSMSSILTKYSLNE